MYNGTRLQFKGGLSSAKLQGLVIETRFYEVIDESNGLVMMLLFRQPTRDPFSATHFGVQGELHPPQSPALGAM